MGKAFVPLSSIKGGLNLRLGAKMTIAQTPINGAGQLVLLFTVPDNAAPFRVLAQQVGALKCLRCRLPQRSIGDPARVDGTSQNGAWDRSEGRVRKFVFRSWSVFLILS